MKYVKMLGLLAIAASALFAFAATASATTVTKSGAIYTGKLAAATEGHAILHDTSGLGLTIECNGTVEGEITKHGAGVTASGPITSLTWSNCTNNWTVTTLLKGSLEIHNIAGTSDGTLTSTGTEVTTFQHGTGLHCIYKTNATDIGRYTATPAGGKSTLDISATIPRTGGSSGFFCGTAGAWTGSYELEATPANLPTTLHIDP
ncbi:MAG TPA: hypothetical protein VKB23_12780 [Solirubrobacterales bacterium]|nr:hypothetical protein [Solirubrobacterales bacterium]